MCGLLLLIITGPRVMMFLWYIVNPRRWENAFDSVLVPVFGFLFFPWTTLMFVTVSPHGNVDGNDWLWLGLAFLVDCFSAFGSLRNRNQMPGYAR